MSDAKIKKIRVGVASCGIAAGAEAVMDLLKKEAGAIPVEGTGCLGHCYAEPMVEVLLDNGESVIYRDVKADEKAVRNILSVGPENRFEIPPVRKAKELVKVLALAGRIDPTSFEDYVANGGYKGLEKALAMTSAEVVDEVKLSGLRGRGGGGFPTGNKWGFLAAKQADEKILICNADEGDPGAFMDRALMESAPHQVLEGMLIAAYATGATKLFIYCRAEYPLAIKRLELAMEQARQKGFLGKNLFGTNYNFDMRIKAGAGAFVCGEETALIASLEGERGMPRLKPPFPAAKGYWQQPTNINNVETFANVPWIIFNGGKAFGDMGTEKSKGTKVFALAGKIKKGGLVEVPMGLPLKDVIFGIGGGIKNDKKFKAVQMGGPSGGCVPAELIDTPVTYEDITKTGAIVGSGGMIVMDENTCMVDMARYFLDFTRKESCGKCNYCRIGTKRMLEILERITAGEGKDGDIELLEELAGKVKDGSMCGLGQTAPNPVLTTIRYFRNEYEDHIYNKKCTAKSCKPLITYEITDKCKGCTLCSKKCPVGAISGEVKGQHVIDQDKCIKCGRCIESCKFDAITVE